MWGNHLFIQCRRSDGNSHGRHWRSKKIRRKLFNNDCALDLGSVAMNETGPHKEARFGIDDCVELLLAHRANTIAKNCHGQDVSEIALAS